MPGISCKKEPGEVIRLSHNERDNIRTAADDAMRASGELEEFAHLYYIDAEELAKQKANCQSVIDKGKRMLAQINSAENRGLE